jgi:tRNA pseudouridine13 synthase
MLKQRPDDFQVIEQTDLVPRNDGPFAFYRLEKQGWTTPDALHVVRRRWDLTAERLSYGGLKDRHARTVQHFTIYHGPRRDLHHQRLRVQYLGQLAEPFTGQHIRANEFRLVLRALTDAEAARVPNNLAAVGRDGVPNYFDDQRFGSVRGGGDFVARAMVHGRHEEALRLALVAPYPFDRAEQKRQKGVLTHHWGDWPACVRQLPPGPIHRVIGYLCHHPDDFRGALTRLDTEHRTLYLAAYQSYLWNRILARWIREACRPEQLLPLALQTGELPFVRDLEDAQRAALAGLTLPLPTARTRLDPADPRTPLIEAVLGEEGLTMADLKLKGCRAMFFSRGDRPAHCLPADLHGDLQADDLHPGRQKLSLAFRLPRGCYATLIVKRLLAA